MPKTVEEIKQEIREDIDELLESFTEYKEKRPSIRDVAEFTIAVGSRLVEAVGNVGGVPREQKKEVVMLTVKEIYKKVNPDIPWIPEPFESRLNDIIDRLED